VCGISDISRSYGCAGNRTMRGCLPSQNWRCASIVDFGVPVVPEEWMSATTSSAWCRYGYSAGSAAPDTSAASTSAAGARKRGRRASPDR
jgi:hypothetical protein